MTPAVAGIFIGGASRRMGGRPKGLLVGPSGESLVAHLRRIFDALAVPCVFVGTNPAYAAAGLPMLADDPSTEGPLAGLLALLEHARGKRAIAVACDMPYVTTDLALRLVRAEGGAPIVAARREGRWEPFFARYEADDVLPIARAHAATNRRSLQALFDACAASGLPLAAGEGDRLHDWDMPEDIDRR